MLAETDKSLADDVAKNRMESSLRTKRYIESMDIYHVMDTLGARLNVLVNNPNNVSSINPESLKYDSVVERVAVLESTVSELKAEKLEMKDQIKWLMDAVKKMGPVAAHIPPSSPRARHHWQKTDCRPF